MDAAPHCLGEVHLSRCVQQRAVRADCIGWSLAPCARVPCFDGPGPDAAEALQGGADLLSQAVVLGDVA